MQCPSCTHEAPVQAFGDPLRCPDCGIFYEKALRLSERQAIGGAAERAPSAEKVFLNTDGVVVTNTRFMAHGKTYAMSSVNSVKINKKDVTQSKGAPIAAILCGLFIGFVMFSIRPTLVFYFFPVAILGVGIYWLLSIKMAYLYTIMLTTSSGESAALESRDLAAIQAVERALNQAIVHRG